MMPQDRYELLAQFIGIWMVFVICIVVCVEGVNFDADCSTNACTEDNTICNPEIALTETCTTPNPPDQCADTNAECVGDPLTCECKTAHFVNKDGACDPNVGLAGTCDSTDSATDQCSVADTTCRNDGAGDKCLCIDTHFSDGTGCQTKVAGLNTTCDGAVSATDQCSTAGTECKDDGTGTDRCLCKPTYYPDGSTCVLRSGVIKVAMLQYMYVVPFIISMMTLLR
ncbi:FBN1 [Mytilus edulis]|uniref:FBN1 n=1 Tax=Mytilus edulis TaxID=6550 RepID=A0A8S3U1X7_MYTED|nr:FBN1 [Mytilus edulis]